MRSRRLKSTALHKVHTQLELTWQLYCTPIAKWHFFAFKHTYTHKTFEWNIPNSSTPYLDNLLHRDDVSSVPQADGLFRGETLEALLHHLQTEHIVIIINKLDKSYLTLWKLLFFLNCLHVRPHTSLKSLCSMKIVLVNGTMWLPLASLAGKSGTFTSDWRRGRREEDSVQNQMERILQALRQQQCRVFGFSRLCPNLSTCRKVSYGDFEWFQYSHGSGCRLVQDVPDAGLKEVGLCRSLGNRHPHLQEDATNYYTSVPPSSSVLSKFQQASTLHTLAQKLFIASGGKPLLLSAVRVKRRGSSQSLRKEAFSGHLKRLCSGSMKWHIKEC